MMPKAIDLSGKKFGRLTAIRPTGDVLKNQGRIWECLCSCGGSIARAVGVLNSGKINSCGCIRHETGKALGMTNFKHGEGHGRKTKEYRAWTGIKERCLNVRHPNYSEYGGRGILICSRWEKDYLAFLSDMGCAKEGQSIDRIDVNGNYEPSNCRWADLKTQQRNRRNTKFLTIHGKKRKAMEIADLLGVSRNDVYIFIKILTLLENLDGPSP
jgi:hypothetical protein